MKFIIIYRKPVAIFLITVMLSGLIAPNIAYGLSSGPSQPEMNGFKPVGNSDMVDLFSGDFSYNIPLMDVGGYPVNLAYRAGASMDDESSWVGYGWSLNVGSVNRQLRGLPDDFNGRDTVSRQTNIKDHIVKGANISATLELLGAPVKKIKKKARRKRRLNLSSLTLSEGVKYDNYRGIGIELGVNAGLSLTDHVSLEMNEGQKEFLDITTGAKDIGNTGLNLSSFDGASVGLNLNIIKKNIAKNDRSISKSIGFSYNTRSGLEGMTLGTSFNSIKNMKGLERSTSDFDINKSFISFNSPTYTPTIEHPATSNSYTFTFNVGPELFVAYLGFGVTGFYSKTSTQKFRSLPAYGFLNSEKGKQNSNEALMDFNREKDIPYMKEVKYLPIPVPTYDLYNASSQDGSGQYHLYRGSSGIFFDNRTESKNSDFTAGVEFGGGAIVDDGFDLYHQTIKTKSQKWSDRNNFLAKGDFQNASSTSPLYEPAYFKRVGEPVPYDSSFVAKLKGTGPVSVSLPSKLSNGVAGAEASDKLRTKTADNGEATSTLIRDKREVRNTTFSYLTAQEAANHGLETTIKDINPDSLLLNSCNTGGIKNNFSRVGGYRKAHHISEITITGDDGKRSVYGVPVYNTYQEETTFSIDTAMRLRRRGITNYNNGTDNSVNNQKGLEHYFSKEITPPYATSYLLTAILSPDYVDRTDNGVTDDDLGTAVKFSYTRLNSLYKWRTPYAFGTDSANYNEGFLSDNLDDKASYTYGEKEIWYLHSIESKTMVAQFVLEDRKDGLGVLNDEGGVDTTNKLKALKEIRLYSKSDLRLNGNDPSKTVPIKVVHFVYDYSICPGLPNSIGYVGKLTLQRVYFTFGNNDKGRLNPYEFQYDTSHFNFYDYRQYDRWGNFKNVADNPGGLNNSEFPYVIQNTALANEYASVAQLNKIILPSGGSISVTYESDDYAYVQNKRASQMCFLNGVGNQGSSSGLINADYIYVNLPNTVSSPQEMISRYFEGVDKLYFKCLLDLDGKGHKEYVPGYAKISGTPELIGNNIAKIKLNKVSGTNPIAKSGWQFLRMNLPKYAYPGSNNLESNQSDIVKAIRALLAALGSIKEFIYGYEKRAKNKGYSNKIDLSKSWVRLCSPTKKKLGGGSRVKRIDISDDWVAMSGTAGAKTSTYSQLYDYTTKDDNGDIISSGVASYEPLIGNDENPFRQPVNYKQGQFLGLDNYYYIEQPFGESFFPAANVGYSRVTVKTIGTGDDESVNRTGTVVSEFFTAKDYPTKLDVLGLQERKPASNKILKLIGGISYEVLGLSQGYSVELNDMHGKPKTVNVYNKSGQNISSVEYFYKTVNELSEKKELTNTVKIIDSTGSVSDGNIGMDVEMFTDMREQTTNNLGVSIKVSGGLGSIFIFPLPFFFPGIGVNYDKRSYRAASTIKVVNRFAIQYKVRKTENGSSITSENLLWDAETGNVLLTKTQNEYDDPVYSFAYPAHWVYSRMGQAYQNLGTIMSNFSTGSDGTISNSTYNSLLVPGDELIDINSSSKYWVINSPVSSIYKKRLINEDGAIQAISGLTVKVVRSGFRNMANTAIATITSLNNPVVGDKLDISQITKILDSKATVFNEEWSMPVKNIFSTTTSTVCNVSTNCMERFIRASMILRFTHGIYLPASFYSSDSTAPYSAWYIISSAYGVDDSSCYSGFLNDSSAESVPFYQYHVGGTGINLTISNGDSAQLGNCKMHFDYVDTEFLHLTHYYISVDSIIDGVSPCFGSVRVITDANIPCGFDVVRDSTAYCAKDTILKFHLDCSESSGAGTCIDPVGKVFNPYYAGILGNWRADSQFVYQVSRENLVTDPAKFGSTDIRKSGAYSLFNPFWKYNTTTKIWEKNPSVDKKWIAANHVTYFNDKGIEIENKDALNRYSSALFGYLESLPVAVASNSRYREIAYDGFEDYGFNLDCSTQDTCNKNGHFDFHKLLNGSTVDTTSLYAHSGKYSLKVSSSVTINKTVYDSTIASANPVEFDNSGRYLLNGNELVKGFSPIPGKKYILSFWVKDGSPRDATTSVQATINGTNLISNLVSWPVVEGWKRVEQQFTLSSSATSFTFQLNSGGGTVYFDDIRIHPFDGQMKTFAYDPSSQRLMAELDENNFATFYEYDDEGILIRVKKETERGIMTIKETRSSYRKRQ